MILCVLIAPGAAILPTSLLTPKWPLSQSPPIDTQMRDLIDKAYAAHDEEDEEAFKQGAATAQKELVRHWKESIIYD